MIAILKNGKKLTEYRLKKWNSMTNNNEHTELRIDLGLLFNECKEGVNLFVYCKSLSHDKGLTWNELEKRRELTYSLLEYIKKNYGQRIYELINQTL